MLVAEGYKKCPQCATPIEFVNGCLFITCICTTPFCFTCKAKEVENQNCINGCLRFPTQTPKFQIKDKLKREISNEEKLKFANLDRTFRESTQHQRDIIKMAFILSRGLLKFKKPCSNCLLSQKNMRIRFNSQSMKSLSLPKLMLVT